MRVKSEADRVVVEDLDPVVGSGRSGSRRRRWGTP
jgi:hypothetical protein